MATTEPSKPNRFDEENFTRTWETKLIRCFPCGLFWKAIACPCIFYGETAQRLRDPTVPAEKENDDCMEFARDNVLFSTCALSIMEHRAEIRRRYGIKGSATKDCLVSCFCCACAVMQHEDELKTRHARDGIVVKEPYKAEQPMMAMAMQQPPQGHGPWPGPQPAQGQANWVAGPQEMPAGPLPGQHPTLQPWPGQSVQGQGDWAAGRQQGVPAGQQQPKQGYGQWQGQGSWGVGAQGPPRM